MIVIEQEAVHGAEQILRDVIVDVRREAKIGTGENDKAKPTPR